jgi:four helix bundle protein
MGDFKDLRVWQKAHHLTTAIYTLTRGFPKEEHDGLVSQMRRASSSVDSNIAEGCSRKGDGDLRRSLQIARGSVGELESQLLTSRDVGYINRQEWEMWNGEAQEVNRMLNRMIDNLRLKPHRR